MIRTRSRRGLLVLLLCLLALHAQTLAEVLLPCLNADGAAVACPLHRDGPRSGPATPSSPLACVKCSLNLALAAFQPIAAVALAASPPMPSVRNPSPGPHYYRFTPERDRRPPISALA